MVQRTFVLYKTTEGTPTQRPAFMWYDEDDIHVPDLTDFPSSSYVSFPLAPAVGYFEPTDPSDPLQRNRVVIDPSGPSWALVPTTRAALEVQQRLVWGQIQDLTDQYAWTQRLDAKITVATRAAFSTYLDALQAMTSDPNWTVDPSLVSFPTVPAILLSATAQGEVLGRPVPGTNYIENSIFLDLDGIVLGGIAGGALTETSVSLRQPPATWSGVDFNTLMAFQNGVSTDQSLSISFLRTNADGIVTPPVMARLLMPVKPGDRIEAHLQVSSHRCSGTVRVHFVDNTGAIVSGGTVNLQSIPANVADSSTNPDQWPRYGNFAIAPAGATFVYMSVAKLPTTVGATPSNSYLFMHKPYLGIAHERQDSFSLFVEGKPRYLAGTRMRNLTIKTAQIADNEITYGIQVDAFGPFTHVNDLVNAQVRAQITTIGAVSSGETWAFDATFRARKQTDANPILALQYQVWNVDLGYYSPWRNVPDQTLAYQEMTTDWEPYTFTYRGTIVTPDLRLRVAQTGIGVATGAQVLKDVSLIARKTRK